MLILSRKSLESVVVGGSAGFERVLKVTVLEIKGRSVRLGFEVDSADPVHCGEVVGTDPRRRPAGQPPARSRGAVA
jgi:sRNA-binding carbon storage regulator CsrA